jgi:thiamine-monophosphate kinase
MIFADKIPLNKNLEEFLKLKRHAKTQKSDIENRFKNDLFFALNGGEDFELLFTINPKKKLRLENALKNFTFSCVGEITEDIEGIKLISGDKTQILTARGFRHF